MSDFGVFKPPFVVIQRGKEKSEMLASAVVKGYGMGVGQIGYGTPLADIPETFMPVYVGVHPQTIQSLRDCHAAQRPFVTVDNGYFKGYKRGGYFRLTTNAMQWAHRRHGANAQDMARFKALDMPVQPLRLGQGEHILIACQSPTWYQMMGLESVEAWVNPLIDRLRLVTDRPIRVRQKPLKGVKEPPIEEDLEKSWAVVAYSSNTLIEAALMGIPIFPMAFSAATPLGSTDLSTIESAPFRNQRTINRPEVFAQLAGAQWTIPEIESGKAWLDLSQRYDPDFKPLA
ncbi:hypothetical protein CcrC1_gp164 [Caulobacter phage C1]|nr:hypothetical protein CcrC1_gp164 [Caulobacter phage C1]UTU08393.1 hypothetical protein CcrC2_gp165 [Caulobacter phage C2]UTU08910.1 hypothetical protein CcrJ4_gp159 [Caulobacter phage J4]UTU09466.1 hypothetical protein CcrBL47_gp180 [Caulobacter phage BL47]UTU10026.1 hypothetical protein CcrRB23_gp164 [Caulobacter phage RB23]WGN97061.1 hypothetical protein [Bertelyvirus sp.]